MSDSTAICGSCNRTRTEDSEDYSPLQVVYGAPLGWYSGDDGQVCPQCMETIIRGPR